MNEETEITCFPLKKYEEPYALIKKYYQLVSFKTMSS